MKNQVQNLQELGIKACAVLPTSEMSQQDMDGILNGQFSIVFISPESLEVQLWRGMLKTPVYRQRLCLVACDEAHCISQWGSDFRPQYRNVSILRSLCSKCPFVLMTATCTDKMKADILECLLLKESTVTTIAVVPDRPNIYLHFKSEPSMKFEEELKWFIKELADKQENTPKAIIYCRTISDAAEIYEFIMYKLAEKAWLRERKVENRILEMFHSSVSKGSESRVLEIFPQINSTVPCVVATIAFGMGVQVPDIEIIIHWGVSKNVLSYMQEIGRCGRDGRQGHAYLYANLRSLDKRRTDEDMIDLCQFLKTADKEIEPCMRVGILERLTVRGMKTNSITLLKNRQKCQKSCKECDCGLCKCCSLCASRCPCKQIISSQGES